MSQENRCSQIIESLLKEIAPPDGIAALFLRHPLGAAFFPLALASGSEFTVKGDEIIARYFLFSMEIDSSERDEIHLRDDSAIEDLVLRGKLALAIFNRGPVLVRTYPCSQDDTVVISTIAPDNEAANLAPGPSPNILQALVEAVGTWQYLAETSIQIEEGDPDQVATALTNLLSDVLAGPPYFPVLYVAVDWRIGRKGDRAKGRWRANALSYNWYLLADREAITANYVKRMFDGSRAEVAYLDDGEDGPKGASGLPGAIAKVCVDLVHRIGGCSTSGTTVYARRNIPKTDIVGNPARNLQWEGDLKSAPCRWALLRFALEYLSKKHTDSALVTAWVGEKKDDGSLNVLPVGFVPGEKIHVIEKVADDREKIIHLRADVTSVDRHLSARLVLLDSAQPHRLFDDNHELAKNAVMAVVERGAVAIRGVIDKFPGPYILDFQGGGGPLLISSRDLAVPGHRSISRHSDEALWDFLHALWQAYKEKREVISESQYATIWAKKVAKRDPNDFVEAMKAKLRRNKAFPVNPDFLFANVRNEGWRFPWERGSVCKNTMLGETLPTVENIETFDPNRKLGQHQKASNVNHRK